MAEAAVEFLLFNLKDLLLYRPHLISGNEEKIESLIADIQLFNAYLVESHRNGRKDKQSEEMDRNIRKVVYEIEDVIDAFVTKASEKKSTSSFFKFSKHAIDLQEIGTKVEELKWEVERARVDITNLKVYNDDKYGKTKGPPELKDVVGFADVTEELIGRLTKETDYFDVVCLTGMFGLGKTTLACKIFNDPKICHHFPVRVWLSISHEFSEKDIFLDILSQFTTITDDIREKDDKAIARMVSDYLETGRFLIVMDDVWTSHDWDRLKDAMPNHNNEGKIFITSRLEDVGKYACYPRPPHLLRFFTHKESWELLRLKALHNLDCPPELVDAGKLIARDCHGLPLSIMIIGYILDNRFRYSDINAMREAWEKVPTKVTNYVMKEEDFMNYPISLSYDKLPYHLRACFLYLGLFPEDYEIPASRLIPMWIGEGFIQQSNDCSLEETGEKYLEDLINKNLVRIEKVKPDGKIKTCRVHDTLREFCQIEAKNENLFQEIKFSDGGLAPGLTDLAMHRRLSVHTKFLSFISSKPSCPRLRSLVCFSKEESTFSSETTTDIFKTFKLLRVLDINPISFPKVTGDLFQLFHVRYIALSVDLSTLPSKFSELWNLQTLIVHTTSKTLDVKVDIGKLIQLRIFETNACAALPVPSEDRKNGAQLHTLGIISVESCTTELFQHASNLKKLGIRGQLSLLLEGKKGFFDSVGRMKNLENLKLINDVHPRPPSEGKLNGLPQHDLFPSRLKSLTLCATFLDWSHMSILASVATLKVLKLKYNAFVGKSWKATDGGFQRLESLNIEQTDLAVWTASSHHYPTLRRLVLRNCAELLEVPIELADIETFQELQLYSCKSAVDSARDIKGKKVNSPFSLQMND